MKFPIYLEDWAKTRWETEMGINGLKSDFEITDVDLNGVEILLAYYSYENSGEAFVLFRKDGVLYEVNGSHCSCYGLEGQWKPEEVMLEELEHRTVKGEFGKEYSWIEEKDDYEYTLNELGKNVLEVVSYLKQETGEFS